MGIYLGPFRLTKRGVRVRIGPRAARLHIGAGGPGLSTGAGPFTFYQPLRGKRRRGRRAAPRHTSPRAPRPQGQPGQKWSWKKRILVTGGVVIGSIVLIGVISAAFGPGHTPAPAQHGPAAKVAASSSPAARSTPAAGTTTTTPAVQPSTRAPAPQQTTQPVVQQTTTAAAPPPPAGCTPRTPSGGCYEAGEFCSSAEHGETGVAGDGAAIKCEPPSSGKTWRWVDV